MSANELEIMRPLFERIREEVREALKKRNGTGSPKYSWTRPPASFPAPG